MNTSMGMGGMNPTMMNPMMGMGMGDGMNPMMGMPGMGMVMPGMGGMPALGGGMGMGGPMGPGSGGMGGPAGAMGGAGGGGGDPMNDRFYKTKMCHKWEQGNCPYGPTCKYAHGPGDMRGSGGAGGGGAGGPRPQGSGKVMTPNGPAAGPGMGMGGMGAMGGMPMGGMGAMGGPMQPRPPAGNAAGGADRSNHWRTRLCEGFMQNGTCKYGDKCTFAHGHHQLRAPGAGGGGGMQRNQGGGGSGGQAQKRALDQGGFAGGANEANKRQRADVPQGPMPEEFPDEDKTLESVEERFQQLVNEAKRFAAATGFSVALYSVGGIYSDRDDTMEDPQCCLSSVRSKDPSADARLKVAVLKRATGGVAEALVSRGEITKFVAQRGVKAVADMRADMEAQELAAQQQGGEMQYRDEDDRASA